jgi:hypothetical protein
MHTLLFAAALGLAQVPSGTPAPAPAAPTQVAPAPAAPLSFHSESLGFVWDRTIPLAINLDGMKVTSIFFNKRKVEKGFFSFLKNAEFGTRAQVEVTNTSKSPRIPGFAVAVLDKDGRLIGAASGGTKLGTIRPGETETFDLNFSQVKERLASGDRFLLAIELRN